MVMRGSGFKSAARVVSTLTAATLSCALVVVSAGCTEVSSETSAPTSSKPVNPGPREQPQVPAQVGTKHTELPADFPASIHLPEGAAIDDAGSRGTSWYVVLSAKDEAEAAQVLSEVITASGLKSRFTEAAPDPAADTLYLRNDSVRVDYLLARDSKKFLLSFDIAPLN